jgi:hypothetical protein
MFKFSLQIDDKKHSLSAEDGISIDLLAVLLKNLYNAIDDGSKTKCTLNKVRGNCYAIDFSTLDEQKETRFVQLHQDLLEVPYDKLSTDDQKYAQTLRIIFKNGYYINAYDRNNQNVAHLTKINLDNLPDSYYTQKTVYGFLTELGSDKLASKTKHIRIEGFNRQIAITNEQDLELKPFYRTDKLAVNLTLQVSTTSQRVLSAEMASYIRVSKTSLSENLDQEGYIPLNINRGAKTIDDIINAIYG